MNFGFMRKFLIPAVAFSLTVGFVAPQTADAKAEGASAESTRTGTEYTRRDADGNTPLHLAVQNRDYSMVRELLNRPEVDVNAQNRAGLTPLHLAVMNTVAIPERRSGDIDWNFEILYALLADEADTGLRDNFGISPMEYARSEYKDGARIMMEHQRDRIIESGYLEYTNKYEMYKFLFEYMRMTRNSVRNVEYDDDEVAW